MSERTGAIVALVLLGAVGCAAKTDSSPNATNDSKPSKKGATDVPDRRPGTAKYLRDGKLTERLMIYHLHGGVAGLTGDYLAVEPDGSWSTGSVINEQRREATARGRLNETQLTELANLLSKHDIASLPSHGEPEVNPAVTVVFYGKSRAQLDPVGDGSRNDRAIRGRYYGIVFGARALCAGSR
jgi:hypothetical protein